MKIILKHVLLGFLSIRPMTGYELNQDMAKGIFQFWHAKQSHIYTTLGNLEENKWIYSKIKPQKDRPDRRVYSITEIGSKEFIHWLSQPLTDLDKMKNLLLLKIFFSGHLDKTTIISQLHLQRELQKQQYTQLTTSTEDLINEYILQNVAKNKEKTKLLWHSLRNFNESFADLYIRWISETIEIIEENFE